MFEKLWMLILDVNQVDKQLVGRDGRLARPAHPRVAGRGHPALHSPSEIGLRDGHSSKKNTQSTIRPPRRPKNRTKEALVPNLAKADNEPIHIYPTK
jgi:hypothetical protein